MQFFTSIAALAVVLAPVSAQGNTSSCPSVPAPLYPFRTAAGWTVAKVAHGITGARDLVINPQGRLLIAQVGIGISQHATDPSTGCITSSRRILNNTALNHGIAISPDGRMLYASSATTAWSFAYDPVTGAVDAASRTVLVRGMVASGHTTRTLAIPPHRPDLLVVSYGSDGNIDLPAIEPRVGRAIVKVFDLSRVPSDGYIFAQDGWNAGYGLRNEVALAFDANNNLWGVENSADNLFRAVGGVTTDVHNTNPAEELNYLGDVTTPNDAWYGYPTCHTAWDASVIPSAAGGGSSVRLRPGDQFVTSPNQTMDDASCAARGSRPPRLMLPPHTAPLGAAFDGGSTGLYVALHGSWNRTPPSGYKLVVVPFRRAEAGAGSPTGGYEPVAAADSTRGYEDVFMPPDESQCSARLCARPVGLVFGPAGRLYMTSDTSGEVFMLKRGV